MKPQNSAPRSRGLKWWALGAFVVALIVQCVTVTPGARLRYVAADSGVPIEGLAVVAVWRLRVGNLAGSLDAGVIRVQNSRTDKQGEVHVGAAVMLHPPVFPFSPLYRDIKYLPMAFVSEDRYESNVAASGLRPSPGRDSSSFLIYQRTALDGEILRLERSKMRIAGRVHDLDDSYHREMVRQQIEQARFSCRQGWFCQEVEN